MTREQSFLGAILAHPKDPAPALVYSDWLEERGQEAEALGWRWLTREGQWPANFEDPGVGVGKRWYWCPARQHSSVWAPHLVPENAFALLSPTHLPKWRSCCDYLTAAAALTDLARCAGVLLAAGDLT